MIALKAIQTSFTASIRTSFKAARLSNNKKISTLCLCKSNDSNPEDSTPEGDTQKQELLARIAQLQAQKVRLTDYLDEKSSYLTQFAEEAEAEFDKIGEDALKELDEAGDRIMENIKSRMQAFEESAEQNRLEMEENESKLAAFEGQMEEDRNEGLFFKNLRQRAPEKKAAAQEEMKKIKELTKESAGSKIRRNIYLALIGVLVISIVDSFVSSSADWRKVAVLGAILVGLITQVIYEQSVLSETKQTGKGKTEEEKK
ncbi:8-amino-7-oxononanoate synthase [Parasponia andersonii]|uniref:8-amino-7-oxononanoate synthase n=1 Tax=Parasponia andersonii TaxID=3476 RepID=A0A2P5AK23_PARAD|nr:8-amino-7-oxononanoate synthase [Parasponia andersonii]